MKSKYAILAILTLSSYPLLGINPSEPPPKPPKQSVIVQSHEEAGKDETWAADTQYRSQYIHPSNWGQAGLFRVRSAEALPDGTLTFGVGGEFYSVNNAPFFYGSSRANSIAENIFLGYSPLTHLTLAVMRRSSSTTLGEPQKLISSLGDFSFSSSYSFPITGSLTLAPMVDFLVASNFNDLAPAGTTLSAGAGIAASFNFFALTKLPMNLHANLMYHSPQMTGTAPVFLAPEAFFNFSRYHTINFALGAEYLIDDFIPFIEFEDTIQLNSNVAFFSSPSKITLGSRFTPLANKSLAVLLGADIGLGKGSAPGVPFQPDYQIIGQISYTVGLTQTERKHYYTTPTVNVVDRKFVLNQNVNFKISKAELEADSANLLDEIGKVIKQNNVKKLMIIGHTDSSHTEEFNLKLSQDRAQTVKRYLVANAGIPEDSLIAQGYGKRQPRASNLTEEGRTLNRRVEFFILE